MSAIINNVETGRFIWYYEGSFSTTTNNLNTNEMSDFLIKDLPKEIKELFLRRRKEQGLTTRLLPNSNVNHNLNWGRTVEDHSFWASINSGDFTGYYMKYGLDYIDISNRLTSTSFSNKLLHIKESTKNEKLKELLKTFCTIAYKNNFDKKSMRNLTINTKGELTFLPKGKDCILNDSGDAWGVKNRISGKYGKTFRNFMIQCGIKPEDSEIEELVNLLKSNFSDCTFEVIKGDYIIDIYSIPDIASNTGSLYNSCMNEKPKSFFEIYRDNAEMLILTDTNGKLRGRALLWTTKCGTKIMDRIYGSDSDIYSFKDWAKENDYYYKSHQTYNEHTGWINPKGEEVDEIFEINLIDVYEYYPYMDTFKFTDDLKNYLSNNPELDEVSLNDTDGNREYSEDYIWDEYNDQYIHVDDSVYVERTGSNVHADSCVEIYNGDYEIEHDCINLINGDYAHEDDPDVVYLQDKCGYTLTEEAFICDFDCSWHLLEDSLDLSNFTGGKHLGVIYSENLSQWAVKNNYELNKEEV